MCVRKDYSTPRLPMVEVASAEVNDMAGKFDF
jgi:hypothetical protein